MSTPSSRARNKKAAPAKRAAAAKQLDSKSAWKQRNDTGPHVATLPSGVQVTFVIPNSTALLRADMLPDRLAELAIMAAAYPDGAEGYLADLGLAALQNPSEAVRLKKALREGIELRDWLVAEMLVDPKLAPDEVASGDYPQADIDMLIEFAERRRDTDAAGVKLPIVVLEELATFRREPEGDQDPAPVGDGAPAVELAAAGAD